MTDLPTDIRETNRLVIERFRADGGVGTLGPLHFERIVLLTTTGRAATRLSKSGAFC